MFLISSCLVGVNCRYDGSNTMDEELYELVKAGKAISLCPEILGNLETPREPCEIVIDDVGDARVKGKSGADYTGSFLSGAEKTLSVCKTLGIKKAILQSRSPSCGFGKVYDGTFSGGFTDGNGLTAELLMQNGIKIYTEKNWKD